MLHNYSIVNFESPIKTVTTRLCDGCTSCCEGWLSCNIYGNEVYRGKPCVFLKEKQGCSAYDFRPTSPCKNFVCYWRQDITIPEKFKPNICGNIMVFRKTEDNIVHLDILEGSKPIDHELLDWVLQRYIEKKINSVRWFSNQNTLMNFVSRDEKFKEQMNKLLISTMTRV